MKYLVPFNEPIAEYEKILQNREYWDDLCDEWNCSTMEEKIVRLAGFVQMGGNLNKVINRYAKEKDQYKRDRIQYCVGKYILKIAQPYPMNIYDTRDPFVRRVKRLEKKVMVRFLVKLLKIGVRRSGEVGKDRRIYESWKIKYEYKKSADEILDRMESPYWKDYMSYDRRADYWWSGSRSLW